MKNKLETVIVLIDQIIVIAFTITLVVIIKNIIHDKATSAESVSEQAVIQVQQEPVSTSETAESTIETSNPVDEPSSEIEDTVSTNETADSTINEQSEISDETSEPESDSDVQEDSPKYEIDWGDATFGFDDIEQGADLPTEEQSKEFWDLVAENGTVLH